MSSWRILVVDDEAGMLRSVERVLGQVYDVLSTPSSREAVALAKTFKPDLAILDIHQGNSKRCVLFFAEAIRPWRTTQSRRPMR